MTGEIVRAPTSERLPWCYTLFRGDSTCAECPLAATCERARDGNASRQTVRQAADAAVAAYRASRGDAPAEVPDLILLAGATAGVNDHVVRRWLQDEAWRRTFRVVVATCARAKWDPRTYTRAIAETVGRFAVAKGWSMQPGMFTGPAAPGRFERWVERNRRKHNDGHADRVADREREQLLAGECLFAERLLAAPGETVEEAEAFAQLSFPSWSLAASGGRDDLRLPALAGALASVDPGLPHRVLSPTGEWTWAGARPMLLELIRLEEAPNDDDEPLDLDPELGVLL